MGAEVIGSQVIPHLQSREEADGNSAGREGEAWAKPSSVRKKMKEICWLQEGRGPWEMQRSWKSTWTFQLSLGAEYPTDLWLQKRNVPWLAWLGGLSAGLRTKGLLVPFPVRAHAWVAGQVHSRGCTRGNHTDVSFPLFLLPFPSLK